MQVLIACDPCGNPFLPQLRDSLPDREWVTQAHCDLGAFWNGPRPNTLLHIQWPEALFGWREPDPDDLDRIRAKLAEWRDQNCIVATVHNYYPHFRDTANFRVLYEMVYSHAHGLVHLGYSSRDWVRATYDLPAEQIHAVIPLGEYSSFENTVSSPVGRTTLGYGAGDFVCLSVGALRDRREMELLLRGMRAFKHPGKQLLIVGRIPWPSRKRAPLAYLKTRWWLSGDRVRLIEGYIPDEQVQVYLNTADVVVIPRIHSLNSANVALGFTFGRVVVGPDSGVIGELLRETGNPVYRTGDAKDLARALWSAHQLVGQGKGRVNRRYARERWNWERIAAVHRELYRAVMVMPGSIEHHGACRSVKAAE